MMKLARKFMEAPGPIQFAHLFANALITDEVIKFIQVTGISTRNWLQRRGRPEGAEEAVEAGEVEEAVEAGEVEEAVEAEEVENH